MPWVTLPHEVRVGGVKFCPIDARSAASVVGLEIAGTVEQALKCYVDVAGKPIRSCTIVLRARHPKYWDIPESLWKRAWLAADMLALSCLAEQRFLEGHLSPHLNATLFRLFGQKVAAGSNGISLLYNRRGAGLRVGGLTFDDVVFQRPPQVEGTECSVVNRKLAKSLEHAQKAQGQLWDSISASLKFFLLGHAEAPDLDASTCIMVSAMAFERLLEPKQRTALGLAEAFSALWSPYATRTIKQARRVKGDHKAEFARNQKDWPLHRKWMKELYEARSSLAHKGPKAEFSSNWNESQHLVIAAFVYPLAVKLQLAEAGLYTLADSEIGACEALDELLDSDWGRGWRKPPEWPSILSESENSRALEGVIRRAME